MLIAGSDAKIRGDGGGRVYTKHKGIGSGGACTAVKKQ